MRFLYFILLLFFSSSCGSLYLQKGSIEDDCLPSTLIDKRIVKNTKDKIYKGKLDARY